VLYPQNGDRIVTIDSVTSLHSMYSCTMLGNGHSRRKLFFIKHRFMSRYRQTYLLQQYRFVNIAVLCCGAIKLLGRYAYNKLYADESFTCNKTLQEVKVATNRGQRERRLMNTSPSHCLSVCDREPPSQDWQHHWYQFISNAVRRSNRPTLPSSSLSFSAFLPIPTYSLPSLPLP